MKMNIKTRITFYSTTCVLAALIVSMIITFFFVRSQRLDMLEDIIASDEATVNTRIEEEKQASQKWIDQGARTFTYLYQEVNSQLEEAAREIGSASELAQNIAGLNQLAQMGEVNMDTFSSSLDAVVRALYQKAQAFPALRRATLFDASGKWVSMVEIQDGQANVYLPIDPKDEERIMALSTDAVLGEELRYGSWETIERPRQGVFLIQPPLAPEPRTDFNAAGGAVYLSITAPLGLNSFNYRTNKQEYKQVGLVEVRAALGEELLSKAAGISGLDFGVFLTDGARSAGTLEGYEKLPAQFAQAAQAGGVGMDFESHETRSFSRDAEKYMEALYPIRGLGGLAGLLSIAVSQAQTERQIAQMRAESEETRRRFDAQSKRSTAVMSVVMVGVALAALLLAGGVTYFLAGFISRPVSGIARRLKDIAQGEGDLTRRIPIERDDELGMLANWFNMFAQTIQELIKQVRQNVDTLSDSSTNLEQLAGMMAGEAENLSGQSEGLAGDSAAVQASMHDIDELTNGLSESIASVATATEEMTATINDVSASAASSAATAGEAMEIAEATGQVVHRLKDAAGQIGQVLEVIMDIAQQTNLLALNATIEAARAGEAGKGFAVVAGEVKQLAKQSEESVGAIREQIQGIQDSTQEAVEAIDRIVGVIKEVNEISGAIAAAVEQQSATTNDIARNIAGTAEAAASVSSRVSSASDTTGRMAVGLEDISRTSRRSREASQDTLSSSKALSQVAESLNALVGKFKV